MPTADDCSSQEQSIPIQLGLHNNNKKSSNSKVSQRGNGTDDGTDNVSIISLKLAIVQGLVDMTLINKTKFLNDADFLLRMLYKYSY